MSRLVKKIPKERNESIFGLIRRIRKLIADILELGVGKIAQFDLLGQDPSERVENQAIAVVIIVLELRIPVLAKLE